MIIFAFLFPFFCWKHAAIIFDAKMHCKKRNFEKFTLNFAKFHTMFHKSLSVLFHKIKKQFLSTKFRRNIVDGHDVRDANGIFENCDKMLGNQPGHVPSRRLIEAALLHRLDDCDVHGGLDD